MTDIFEPDLELTKPFLPYEDYGIQGVWPRNHKVPSDIFPTFNHIAGLNQDKSKARGAGVTDERRLMVDAKITNGGGGSSSFPFTKSQSGDEVVGELISQWDTIVPAPNRIYRLYFSAYAGFIAHFAPDQCSIQVYIGDYNQTLLTPIWSIQLYAGPDPSDGTKRFDAIDLLFPGGIVFPGTFDDSNPFTIWAVSSLVNTVLKSLYWFD